MPDFNPSTVRAKSSIKSLNFELTNLTPSSLVTFFEIDISSILKDQGIQQNLTEEAVKIGFSPAKNLNDGILRFHNNIKIFNSYVVWQGNTYYPAPIQAEGFESTSRGVLPRPNLTIASQSETGSDQLALLKHEIRKIGDIISAKVTRRRTFAKYLDVINFPTDPIAASPILPDGYEPDPYAELPKDIYFIERKTTENKNVLTYELSSILDLEGIKIPKRVIVADKCVWQYRGIGCWYQDASTDTVDGEEMVPLLNKAELNYLDPPAGVTPDATTNTIPNKGLPTKAPPAGTENDQKMRDFVAVKTDQKEWKKGPRPVDGEDLGYQRGDYVYLLKDKIKYYFVSTGPLKNSAGEVIGGDDTPDFPNTDKMPPNTEYWVADECSKSLTGCRMRWGSNGTFKHGNTNCQIKAGDLPFGGFPAARKISQGR
jgi:lambda family phage minor tail protein L